MSGPNVEFTSTSDFLPSWNCMSKGSSKENNLEWLQATDESWIVGYYISQKDVTIKDRPYVKIRIRATHVGSNEHLRDIESVDETGTDVEILSTGVLTNKILESVQPGQYVKIMYKGKIPKKSNPAESYHNWDVAIAGGQKKHKKGDDEKTIQRFFSVTHHGLLTLLGTRTKRLFPLVLQ